MKEYKITFQDYVNAQYLYLGIKRWIVQILFALTILYAFTYGVIQHIQINYITLIIPYVLAMLLIPFLRKKRYKKIYDSQKSFRNSITIKYNNDFIELKNNSSFSNIPWKDIYKYKINNKIIIIFCSINLFFPIPKTAFENEAEMNNFLKLLYKNKS